MVICAGVGVLYHVDHLLRRDQDREDRLCSVLSVFASLFQLAIRSQLQYRLILCTAYESYKLATLRNVRAFFWYLLFSLPLGIAVPTWLLASGKAPELSHSDKHDKRSKISNISNEEWTKISQCPTFNVGPRTQLQVCSSVVEDEVQRLGPAFVCGFTDGVGCSVGWMQIL